MTASRSGDRTDLSPKAVALAMGVSESSLKRWIDQGLLSATRTAGGHRRVDLAEVLAFMREHGYSFQDPGAVGLEVGQDPDRLRLLIDGLCSGVVDRVRDLFIAAWLAEGSIAALADGLVRSAMASIGTLWMEGPEGIVVEHISTVTCLQALSQLHHRIPTPPTTAPLAVGGGVANDPDLLPLLVGTMAFQENGWQTINLGPDMPFAGYHAVIAQHRPRLVWLTLSHAAPDAALAREILVLADGLAEHQAHLLVGGRRASELKLEHRDNLLRTSSLGEATAFGRGLLAAS